VTREGAGVDGLLAEFFEVRLVAVVGECGRLAWDMDCGRV
jgi:hypothetical protein